MGSLVLHGGGSRDDAEGGVLREHGGELVGHAVGKVVLGGVAGEVIEWEDSERGDPGCCVAIEGATSQAACAET